MKKAIKDLLKKTIFFHDIDHEVEKEFEKNLRIAYERLLFHLP